MSIEEQISAIEAQLPALQEQANAAWQECLRAAEADRCARHKWAPFYDQIRELETKLVILKKIKGDL